MAEHFRAFNEDWFARHQRTLLRVLQHPLTGRLARWMLRIRKCDVGHRGVICELRPNSYTVFRGRTADGEAEFTTDFRTHDKYAKRMYYVLKPLWWAMHAWDWLVADRWVPQLSFGFSTLTAYPSPGVTVDGYVARSSVDEPWGTLISGAGNSKDDASTALFMEIDAAATTNQWRGLVRIIFLFDTSALGASASISAATLSLYGLDKQDFLSIAPDLNIYTSTPASNTVLANADYAQVGSTAQCDSPVSYAGWTNSAYNDFSLNATGRGNISKTDISKFGARNANYDVAAVAPTWSSGSLFCYFQVASSDTAGTTQDPKLVVTYTTGGGAKVRNLLFLNVG